jgi:RES domain-containing protein
VFAFRIADARHAIFSASGAMLHGGRWNSIGQPVIYAAETYAGALLEILVHANLSSVPKNHRAVTITIPDQITIETLRPQDLPGWNLEDLSIPKNFGDRWIREGRSAVLRVPGVVTGGHERNVLFNPAHPDFAKISASEPEVIPWDRRLFRSR